MKSALNLFRSSIKRGFLILGIFFFLIPRARAQIVEGQQAMELSGGKSDLGYIINGGYLRFLSTKLSLKFGAFYESGTPYQFTYHNYGMDALARYNLIALNSILYITPYGGFTANYDHLSPIKQQYSSSFNYGFKGGLEAEVMLSEEFSFFGFFNQLLLLKVKPFGRERYDYGIGVRLYLEN